MMTLNLMTRHILGIASAALCIGAAHAEGNFSKSTYDAAKTDIKNTYKAERDKCSSMTGNSKDVCIETAKGQEKVALAQLEANYTGRPHDEQKLREAKYEARYDIAKEKCDDLTGDAKNVCVQTAKTERDKAKADLKQAKSTADAAEDAESTRMKADYKLAVAKCDTLAGDAKDVCIASAKARHNQGW